MNDPMTDVTIEPRPFGLPADLLYAIALMLNFNDLVNFSRVAYEFHEIAKGPLYHTITVGLDGDVPLLLADTVRRLSIASVDHVLNPVKAQEPLTTFTFTPDERFEFLEKCARRIHSSVDVTQPQHLALAERWACAIYRREATSFVGVLLALTPRVKDLGFRVFSDGNQDAPSTDPLKSLFGGAIHCPGYDGEPEYYTTRFLFDHPNEYYHPDRGVEDNQEAFDAALSNFYPPLKARKPLLPLRSRLASVTRLSVGGTCIELLALGFENLTILEVDVVRNPSAVSDISLTDKDFVLPKLTTLVVHTDWKLHATGIDQHRTAGYRSIRKLLDKVDMPRIKAAIIVLEHHPLH